MGGPRGITVSYDCLLSVDGQLLLGVQLTSNRTVLCFLFLEKAFTMDAFLFIFLIAKHHGYAVHSDSSGYSQRITFMKFQYRIISYQSCKKYGILTI